MLIVENYNLHVENFKKRLIYGVFYQQAINECGNLFTLSTLIVFNNSIHILSTSKIVDKLKNILFKAFFELLVINVKKI